MNRAGNAMNHPENLQPDPHTDGTSAGLTLQCLLSSLSEKIIWTENSHSLTFGAPTSDSSTFSFAKDLRCPAHSL